jgi:hypothetical protein
MMSRALTRRAALAICAVVIVAVAARGTLLQRRSLADYDRARSALRSDIARYEGLLVKGEKRSRAAAALQAAGAQIESPRGDIVITVLQELGASSKCRSLVGMLHVGIDSDDRVDGWETPPLDAECD